MSKKFKVLMVLGVLALAVIMATTGWAGQKRPAAKKTLTVAVPDLGNETWWPPAFGWRSLVVHSIGDGLVRGISPNDVEPLLAKSWTVTPDGLKWDFTLRDGVYFHDGTKVTAEDMKFVIDQRQNYVGYSGMKAKITSVEARGNHLTINQNAPIPQMLDNYLNWLPARPKAYIDKVGWDGYNKNPIGSGPFKFVEHRKGEYAKLAKNEKYYGQKPQFDEVILKIVPEPATRIAMMRTGEADIMLGALGATTAELTRYGFRAIRFGPPSQDLLFFNRLLRADRPKSMYDDVRVRQAILYAINRGPLAKAIYHGMADEAGSVPIVGKALSAAYNKDLPVYPYDPAKAKQLLAEAGYPNGFEMEIRARVVKKDLAEVIASDLAQVGIKVKIVIWEQATYMDTWYKRLDNSDFVYLDWNLASGPAAFAYLDRTAQACNYASPTTDLRNEGDKVVGLENQYKWMRDVLSPALYKEMGVLPLTEIPQEVIGIGPRIKSWPKQDIRSMGLEFIVLHD